MDNRVCRRMDGLRSSLVGSAAVTAKPPPQAGAAERLSVLVDDGIDGEVGRRWLSSDCVAAAGLLLEQLRRHSFTFVRWKRSGSDTSVRELFRTTAHVFGDSALHSQFYACA